MKEIQNIFLTDLFGFSFSLKRLALSILCNWQLSSKKECKIYSYLISSFCFSLKRLALSILWITFIKEKKSRNILWISSFCFSLKRLALSILCNWQLSSKKEIQNILLPYLFILFQSEKISIKHSMQLTITFIKEKKSIIYSYLISSFSFSLKRLLHCKHSMQLIITFIKERNP